MRSRRGVRVHWGWLAVALAASPVPEPLAGQEAAGGNCATCHQVLDERLARPTRTFGTDIHSMRGLGCVACHGGDETVEGLDAMDPAKGFLGKPRGRGLLEVCGRCHSDAEFMRRFNPSVRVDQIAEYTTSVHGQRLATLNDTAVATCSSCHPAHEMRPPTDPQSSVHPLRVAETCASCHADTAYMRGYGIPTDQLEKYYRSIHWQMMSESGDLGAPTCNDCHGNHGAAPPGLSWVGNVCGQCHAVMAEFFGRSRHAQTFAMLGVPGCAGCHGNHEIREADTDLLGLGEGAVCGRCHSAQDPGGQVAHAMWSLLDSLETQFMAADSLLRRAVRAGMEVSQAQFELESANNALVGARAAVHTFNLVAVRAEVESGLGITEAAYADAGRALEELQFRRVGLAVSVAIIVALIVGLVLKIRQLERSR